jgi:uracil DNA glycosylase superfamily protein
MTTISANAKKDRLIELSERIRSHKDWWCFPAEAPIQGFMGRGPIFIVGDQPSTDKWLPEHPNRRVFYDTLQKVGLQNAHLTDLYKKRGLSSRLEWCPPNAFPDDFPDHVSFFREEIEILQPTLIVALGQLAQRLLIQNVTEWGPAVPRIWHFSHVVREGKKSQYEANMREIIWGT